MHEERILSRYFKGRSPKTGTALVGEAMIHPDCWYSKAITGHKPVFQKCKGQIVLEPE